MSDLKLINLNNSNFFFSLVCHVNIFSIILIVGSTRFVIVNDCCFVQLNKCWLLSFTKRSQNSVLKAVRKAKISFQMQVQVFQNYKRLVSYFIDFCSRFCLINKKQRRWTLQNGNEKAKNRIIRNRKLFHSAAYEQFFKTTTVVLECCIGHLYEEQYGVVHKLYNSSVTQASKVRTNVLALYNL